MIDVDRVLPDRPERLAGQAAAAWSAPITLPTYLPETPSRYPAYLSRRVYQGSSGRVFPLPFHDRIRETCEPHEWQGLHLENEYLRVLVLPELGGRVQLARDLRTGYSLFYWNPVIKPALVGLAGPWLAGGIEFNWPQHHRPATFLPTEWSVDETGAVTCGDHDPFARMKGMHTVRLRPGSTVLELEVRLHNRSELPQTFLWWANAAAEVHDDYQSFFPADVRQVADHAKRAVSTFPEGRGRYYGIDYPSRRPLDSRTGSPNVVAGDRLDWPRNIPVPTSFMAVGSTQDFFGGYDHRAQAGFVHWADHQVAVGKKQWTWGDGEFGRVWNRNLDDRGRAYVELMAGVYSDNQPDFAHLAPGETKTFRQYWYPLAGTGPACLANLDVALAIESRPSGGAVLRLDATHALGEVRMIATGADGQVLLDESAVLSPDDRVAAPLPTTPGSVRIEADGVPVLEWRAEVEPAPEIVPAQEPAPPAEIPSVEELYLTGRHLDQYRHATRSPEPYWAQALARDPGHAPTHAAFAARRLRDARFADAEAHARAAVARLTALNPNPESGEAHYLLGLALVHQGRDAAAYDAFAKAAWLDAWAAPANLWLARLDARAGRDEAAVARAEAALSSRPDLLQARDLRAAVLRRLGRVADADSALAATLALDPLDAWARQLTGRPPTDAQVLIDVALEHAAIGSLAVAAELFGRAREADRSRPLGQTACGALASYHQAVVYDRLGDAQAAAAARGRASAADRTWNYPSRLEDVAALIAAGDDPTALALLGHWLYAHDRPDDAIAKWDRSVELDPSDPVVWRNLAVARFNHRHDAEAAADAYESARALAPDDARLLFEADQLAKRLGHRPDARLARLEERKNLVLERDDLLVEHAQLLTSAGRADEALDLLADRVFQPWEGGEGLVLHAWDRACLAAARRALADGDPAAAIARIEAALEPPQRLGEARHPLANPSELCLTLGDALAVLAPDDPAAQAAWARAAESAGDFQEMSPASYSESTYFTIVACRRLGEADRANALTRGLAEHVAHLEATPARIDYFATSLPELMLFDDDPQRRQDASAKTMRAQLAVLADDLDAAERLLAEVLADDPARDGALDLRNLIRPFRSDS